MQTSEAKTKRNTPIRREGEPFSRLEEKHFLHVKATTRVDGSPGISVRTLVAKVEQKNDDVEWKRGRSGDKLLMRKMDDCRLAVPRGRRNGDGKFAEKIREIRKAMHAK